MNFFKSKNIPVTGNWAQSWEYSCAILILNLSVLVGGGSRHALGILLLERASKPIARMLGVPHGKCGGL